MRAKRDNAVPPSGRRSQLREDPEPGFTDGDGPSKVELTVHASPDPVDRLMGAPRRAHGLARFA
jgi:hypothetical protein